MHIQGAGTGLKEESVKHMGLFTASLDFRVAIHLSSKSMEYSKYNTQIIMKK